MRSSSLRMSRFCSPCPSAHSLIISCSLRICARGPESLRRGSPSRRSSRPVGTCFDGWRATAPPRSKIADRAARAPSPRIFAHRRREPVFQIGVKSVLRLAGLQIEEAEDQRSGEAEQRRRERNAHAAERCRQSFLQRIEHRAGIATDFQAFDHVTDRTDCFDQAPERAEQAEEDQKTGHVARDVPRLIKPRPDRIEQMPHGLLRDRHPPGAITPRMTAIGASSVGRRSGAMPGSAMRKELTQETSG